MIWELWIMGCIMAIVPWGKIKNFNVPGIIIQLIGLAFLIINLINMTAT